MAGPGEEYLVRRARAAGVRDERVLAALAALKREDFVPGAAAGEAYADEPVPIPAGQVTSQPSLIATMVEALDLTGSERVLEVGTGYGFQTALLAALADEVVSIERFGELARAAEANLVREGIENVTVLVGDGSAGVPERAPFDAIIVSAAFPEVPRPLIEQLAPGGRLVQPVGPGGHEEVLLYVNGEHGLEARGRITGARFVRLYGAHAYPEAAPDPPVASRGDRHVP